MFAAAQPPATIHHVILVLGVLSGISATATVFSCRSFVSSLASLFGIDVLKSKLYGSFFRYHGFYWWALGVTLMSHLLMATSHTGLIPLPGDPDGWIHLTILALGVVAAVTISADFLTCRISPKLLAPYLRSKPMESWKFRLFYGWHGYLWWAFIAVVGAHIVVGILHAGWW